MPNEMNIIICDYQLSVNDLVKFQLSSTFRKPMIIFLIVIAVLMLLTVLMHFLTENGLYDSPPFFQIIFSFFTLVFLPIITVVQAKRMYQANPRFQFPIRIVLSPDFILMTGKGFESKMEWDGIFKIREDKHFIKIYSQKQIVQLVPKRNIMDDTLEDIRHLFSGIEGLDH